MAALGTARRLRRLQGPGGRFFLLAADHGLPAGPLPGLADLAPVVRSVSSSITGTILNPGMVRFLPEGYASGLVVHVSAGTLLGASPISKVLSTSAARALSLGADAVSLQIHFGDSAEDRMLADAGRIVEEAGALGLPVLIMAYPPGAGDGTAEVQATCHAARAAAELGADLVQVPHPGSAEHVRSVVRGCPVPLLVSGGPRDSRSGAFLEAVASALAGGACGLSVGRNLFQAPDPARAAKEIGEAILAGPPVVEVSGS